MKEILKNKQLIGVYLLWIALHFTLWMIGFSQDKTTNRYSHVKEFWPFGNSGISNTYDITEFLIYIIVPAILVVAINFIFPQDHDKKEQ